MLHCQEGAAVDGGISGIRAAQNQSRYRSINEDVKAINTVFEDFAEAASEWICECADTECVARVLASLREYQAVRMNPRAFIVSPGHTYPEVERVTAENERFTTVEKLDNGGEVAEALDPRNTP
jgi:hypothetical protein